MANQVVFFPASEKLYGWICLGDLLRQMGWATPHDMDKSLEAPCNDIIPSQPTWVEANRGSVEGRSVVVDVWGVVAP